MAIQNFLGGFEVGWLTFIIGVASALLLRMKFFKSASQKPVISEKQK